MHKSAMRSVRSPPPCGEGLGVGVGRSSAGLDACVQPPDPPPAYRYLGSFGPQTNPLLVFKGNAGGDVVNVQILKKP